MRANRAFIIVQIHKATVVSKNRAFSSDLLKADVGKCQKTNSSKTVDFLICLSMTCKDFFMFKSKCCCLSLDPHDDVLVNYKSNK